MERKRDREVNPPSADPPSATPVARANLPGSVAAAFNGTSLHALSLPDVICVCCHVSSLNFAFAGEFLPPSRYGMRSHPLCITGIFFSVPQNFDLEAEYLHYRHSSFRFFSSCIIFVEFASSQPNTDLHHQIPRIRPRPCSLGITPRSGSTSATGL
jgi:hypothetical protein